MKSIQFYPNTELDDRLKQEAISRSLSVSALVVEILNNHYGLTKNNTKSEAEWTAEVLDDVFKYISTPSAKNQFSLFEASPTFAEDIPITKDGKPNPLRAKIGRNFAGQIGKGRFENVAIAYNSHGRIKRNQNNAIIYEFS